MGVEHATPGIFILMIFLIVPVLVYIRKARKDKDIFVRRIAGIDAIDEATGRAAELGRPISFSTGLTSVHPTLYACLGVLYYVSKKAATHRSKLLVPQYNAEVMAIVEDIVRDAYRAAGQLGNFEPRNIRFLSESQFAFASGYMGMMHRENVCSAFLFGYFAAESLLLAEAGQQVGAMQVGASVSPEQVPFFICACDYTLIGEELYAASAYLSREPIQLGSLCGQDRAKLILFVIIVSGVLIATWNALYPEAALNNWDTWLYVDYSEILKTSIWSKQ